MKVKTSEELFNLFKKNKINVFVAKSFESDRTAGDFAENNKSQKYTWIIVRANNRSEKLESVTEFLDRKDINITYKITPWNRSTFPYISIIPESKKEIRIVFKFINKTEKTNYKWWNEGLDGLFSSKTVRMTTPSDRNEIEVVSTINKKIQELGNNLPIKLKIQNKIFNDVVGLNGGEAGKKSDFVIINSKGDGVGYISYKAGDSATSFQQYAGIQKTAKKDEDASLFLSSDSEVKSFVSKMESFYTEHKENNKKHKENNKKHKENNKKHYFNDGPVYVHINDNRLKNKAVFGEKYGGKKSQDNVDFLCQGKPELSKNGDIIILKFSKKVVANGQLSRLSGDYEPVLGVRKAEANRYLRTIPGVRGGVWTKKYMESRKKSRNLKYIKE
jgi:hypothetical protein